MVQIVREYDVDGDPPDRKNPSRTPTAFWAKTIRMLCSHLKSRRTTATHRDDQQQGATTATYYIPATVLPLTTQLRGWVCPIPEPIAWSRR